MSQKVKITKEAKGKITKEAKVKIISIVFVCSVLAISAVGFLAAGFIWPSATVPIELSTEDIPHSTSDNALKELLSFQSVSLFGLQKESIDDSEPTISINEKDGYMVTMSKEHKGSKLTFIFDYQLYTASEKVVREKTGHRFSGWVEDVGARVVTSTKTTVNITYTYKAAWEKEKYTLIFNSNDGSAVADEIVVFDSTISLSTPTRDNFVFLGWYFDSSFSTLFRGWEDLDDVKIVDLGADKAKIELFAKWTDLFTVKLDTNGGVSDVAKFQLCNNDELPSDIAAPTREGYTFNGYLMYDNEAWVQYFDENMVPLITHYYKTSNITLFANWIANKYSITLDSNGGEEGTNLIKVTFSNDMPQTDTCGQQLIAPVREGFVFMGYWLGETLYYDADFIGVNNWTIAEETTLQARWQEKVFTFQFNSQGGSSIGDKTVQFGETISLEIPVLNDDFIFFGWYLSSTTEDDTCFWNITSANSVQIADLGTNLKKIPLYAKWVAIGDLFDFDAEAGEVLGLSSFWESIALDSKNNVRIPNTIDEVDVVSISKDAFRNKATLKSVSLSALVTDIPQHAFAGCFNLETITGNNVISIGNDAFSGTKFIQSGLTFITVGKVIVRYNGTTNVTEQMLSATNATIIGKGAFRDYSEEITITMPNSFTFIDDNAFANSAVKELRLPKNNNLSFGTGILKDSNKLSSLIVAINGLDLQVLYGGVASGALKTITVEVSGLTSFSMSGGGAMLDKLQCTASGTSGINAITLTNFASITELLLYQNALNSITADDIEIGTLNLAYNRFVSSLNITNIKANYINLVGNGTTSIICTEQNMAVKWIFMPKDNAHTRTGYEQNALGSISFVANLPNLVSLDVANNNVSNISSLANLQNLQELYLGGNPVITTSGGLSPLASIGNTTKITRLNLGGIYGGSSVNKATILTFVLMCPNLQWVELYNLAFTTEEIKTNFTKTRFAFLTSIKITNQSENFNITTVRNHFAGWATVTINGG